MNLQQHINKVELSIADYADAVGISHMTIREALRGNFTHKTALKIYEFSKKQVKLQHKPIKFD